MNSPSPYTIVHQGALGDFLLCHPVFDGLGRLLAPAQFDFLTRDEHFRLIASRPFAGRNCASRIHELAPFHHEDLWRTAEVPQTLRETAGVFLFGQAGSRVAAGRLKARLGPKVHWVRSFPEPSAPGAPEVHITDFLRMQLAELGFPLPELLPEVTPPEAESQAVRAWLADRSGETGATPVVLHPGSGGKGKIWPLRNWAGLVRWVQEETGASVVIPAGPAEEALGDFLKAMEREGAILFENEPLLRLAALLETAQLYVGNDSGVSHLAAAVGAPSVVLFGPTSPAVWAPRGRRVRIHQTAWTAGENLRFRPGETEAPPPELTAILRKMLDRSAAPGRS